MATYLSSLLEMNVSPMQTWWRIIHDLDIVYKNSQNLNWKKVMIMRKKEENKIDRYKKISSALLKKDSTRIWRWNMVTSVQPYITKNTWKKENSKRYFIKDKDKVNVFITLLYPLNGIKFNTSKTRNSSNDFINHLNSIKRYVLNRNVCQEIYSCNRQCIISY